MNPPLYDLDAVNLTDLLQPPPDSSTLIAQGGYSDIHIAYYEGRTVALKTIRKALSPDLNDLRRVSYSVTGLLSRKY